MKLTRETMLEVANALRVEIDHGVVTADAGREVVEAGASLLGLLAAFRVPTTLNEGLRRMTGQSQARVDWVAASALALRCVEAKVLRIPGERGDAAASLTRHSTYESPRIHVAMLDDRARTEAYLRALARTVREGDVVVDVGTGNGVLAVAAARAGARIVYAIEETGIAETAMRVFEQNGVGDRIRVVRGKSTEVVLPELADVMVSELIGHDPLGERALEYTRDAVRRFVKPGGRVIPSGLSVYMQGVELDLALLREHRVFPAATARWREWYATDFAPFEELAPGSGYRLYLPPGEAFERSRPVTRAVKIACLDLTNPPETIDLRATAVATGGRLDAWLSWFELEVASGISISIQPGVAEPSCHWHATVWFADASRQAAAGDEFDLRYRRALTRTQLEVTPK
ncbi:MAG: hypothetical protein EXR75_08360 [Myxococcales bacterium]|nr:hypothetical protein [Myxococcales bacterium]